MKANIKIDLELVIEHSDDGYTAYFPDLDLYGMGSTAHQAKKSLLKTLDMTIDYCVKHGTLFEVMQEAGFNQTIRLPKSTPSKTYSKVNYDIPLGDYGKEKQGLYTQNHTH